MPRITAFQGWTGRSHPNLCSVACIAFVLALGVAFWTGALWLGALLIRLVAGN